MHRHRNRHYYFRVHISADLRELFNNREDFSLSLHSTSRADCLIADAKLTMRWQKAFHQIRHELIEPDAVPALIEQLLGKKR